MHQYSVANNGVKYLLVFIDMYSRFLIVKTLKSLKYSSVVPVLREFFEENIYSYKKIFTDEGSEFISKEAKQIYKRFNVKWYTVFNKKIKSGIAERVIRSLKQKIGKYITLNNSEKYVDVLQDIVSAYNCRKHNSLKKATPIDIHFMNENKKILRFSYNVYKNDDTRKRKSVAKILSQNEYVRLKGANLDNFKKEFFIQNTREIFKIHSVNHTHDPVTYNVEDLENKPIKGVFYREELIPVVNKGVYDINILKTRKVKGKKQYLVKYINYPDSEDRWINARDLVAS